MTMNWPLSALIVLVLVAGAITARRWIPRLLSFVTSNADAIQALASMGQLLLWLGAGIVFLRPLLFRPGPTHEIEEPPTSEPSVGRLPNWVAPFEYGFPPDWNWTEGGHHYTIALDCSGSTRDVDASQEFAVTDQTSLLPDPVYLRISGVFTFRDFGLPIDSLHPAQDTRALANIINLSESEARSAVAGECDATFSWDNQPPEPMQPLDPYEVFAVWETP